MIQPNSKDSEHRLVIIGGVAGGASAAARARRLNEHAKITLIERGPDVSFANCGLPYYIGGEIQDRSRLAVQTPQSLMSMLNIEVLNLTEATEINREHKQVKVRYLESKDEDTLEYDTLILAPGAAPLRPPLPGVDHKLVYTLRNLQDMDRLKEKIETVDSIVIAGAGFIGLEVAEQLANLGKQVSVVELQSQILPQVDPEIARPAEERLTEEGVKLVLGDGISRFEDKEGSIITELASGKQIESGMVLLSIGVRPESQLAKEAGLEIGPRGHIVVDAYQQTSDPAIYAAGDAVQTIDAITGQPTAVPLGGPANRQGRTAADHIFMGDQALPYPGSLGTAIVRVFDTVIGITGFSEKRLKAAKMDYKTTTVTATDHAGYYPGAMQMTLKIAWNPNDGKLLGAQAVGVNGIDKRIDVIATALRAGMTIQDLCHLELAYAPPFGAAKDIVNIAGFSAMNLEDELYDAVYELPDAEAAQIVDVRPPELATMKPIEGSRNIPFAKLRDRLNELDREKPVVTVCALGKTSYFASRVLNQEGFKAQSLVGGMTVMPTKETKNDPTPMQTNDKPKIENQPSSISADSIVKLDATGLACPGPIMRVKQSVDQLEAGQVLEVSATDSGFMKDLPAYAKNAGLELLDISREAGVITGKVRKLATESVPATSDEASANNGTTLVVFSQDMDKALASLVIANGALAMGKEVTMFFTFWGLNVLRKESGATPKGKSFMDHMFGWMMPKGMGKLPLSNMHMGGMGTKMMKWRMASKNLPNVHGLMQSAREQGARMVACSMSMEAMGIRQEELLDDIEVGGVADFLDATNHSKANLFV